MPRYRFELNGKTYRIDSPNELSNDDLVNVIGQYDTPAKPSAPAGPPKTLREAEDASMPGQAWKTGEVQNGYAITQSNEFAGPQRPGKSARQNVADRAAELGLPTILDRSTGKVNLAGGSVSAAQKAKADRTLESQAKGLALRNNLSLRSMDTQDYEPLNLRNPAAVRAAVKLRQQTNVEMPQVLNKIVSSVVTGKSFAEAPESTSGLLIDAATGQTGTADALRTMKGFRAGVGNAVSGMIEPENIGMMTALLPLASMGTLPNLIGAGAFGAPAVEGAYKQAQAGDPWGAIGNLAAFAAPFAAHPIANRLPTTTELRLWNELRGTDRYPNLAAPFGTMQDALLQDAATQQALYDLRNGPTIEGSAQMPEPPVPLRQPIPQPAEPTVPKTSAFSGTQKSRSNGVKEQPNPVSPESNGVTPEEITPPSRPNTLPRTDRIEPMSPSEIGVDPEMQYKKTGIVDSQNAVTNALKGTDVYDVDQGGTWTVFRDENGKTVAVNSHHRRELANRASRFVRIGPDGKPYDVPSQVPVRVLDARDGWTKESARSYGALENIRDGKGTALDALEVVNGMGIKPEQFKDFGISTTGQIAKSLEGLQGLNPEALGRVRMGDLSENAAAGVGSVKGLSPSAQNGAVAEIANAGIENYNKAKNIAEEWLRDEQSGLLAKEQGAQESMFGDDFAPTVSSTRALRVELKDAVRNRLASEYRSLLDPTKTQLRQGEAIDAQGRRADAQNMGESQAAVRERVNLLYQHDWLQTEIAKLAGKVGNGELTKQQAVDRIAELIRPHVGKSVSVLVDTTGAGLGAGGVEAGQPADTGRTGSTAPQSLLDGEPSGLFADTTENRNTPKSPESAKSKVEIKLTASEADEISNTFGLIAPDNAVVRMIDGAREANPRSKSIPISLPEEMVPLLQKAVGQMEDTKFFQKARVLKAIEEGQNSARLAALGAELDRQNPLFRAWNAGNNIAGIQFASKLQRDLYDIGANNQVESGRNPKPKPASYDQMVARAAQETGLSGQDLITHAQDVYQNVKEQMKGVKDLETRTVTEIEAPKPAAKPSPRDTLLSLADRLEAEAASVLGKQTPNSGVGPEQIAAYAKGITALFLRGVVKVADVFQAMRTKYGDVDETAFNKAYDQAEAHWHTLRSQLPEDAPVPERLPYDPNTQEKYVGSRNVLRQDYGQADIDTLHSLYKANEAAFTEHRRGVRSHEVTSEAAKGAVLPEGWEQSKPGTAFNAEQIVAIDNAVEASRQRRVQAEREYNANPTPETMGKLVAAEAEYLQRERVYQGAATEAGRALNSRMMRSEAIDTTPAQKVRDLFNPTPAERPQPPPTEKPVEKPSFPGMEREVREGRIPGPMKRPGFKVKLSSRDIAQIGDLKASIKAKLSSLSAEVIPGAKFVEILPDLVSIGRIYLGAGLRSFGEWRAAMREIAPMSDDQAQTVYDEAWNAPEVKKTKTGPQTSLNVDGKPTQWETPDNPKVRVGNQQNLNLDGKPTHANADNAETFQSAPTKQQALAVGGNEVQAALNNRPLAPSSTIPREFVTEAEYTAAREAALKAIEASRKIGESTESQKALQGLAQTPSLTELGLYHLESIARNVQTGTEGLQTAKLRRSDWMRRMQKDLGDQVDSKLLGDIWNRLRPAAEQKIGYRQQKADAIRRRLVRQLTTDAKGNPISTEEANRRLDAMSRDLAALDESEPKFHQKLQRILATYTPKTRTGRLFNVLGAGRSLVTSYDLSAGGRQGWVLGVVHPKAAAGAFREQIKAFVSEDAARSADFAIRKKAEALGFEENGGYLAPVDELAELNLREEQFLTNLAGRIPGVRASERAYTTYLNQLRVDAFERLATGLDAQGKADVANYINKATGRGGFGTDAWEKAAPAMAQVFFSPRYVASRVQLLVGEPIVSAKSGAARKAILGQYVKFGLSMAAIMTLAKGMGADVETDPKSSDYLKLRKGKTTVDLWTGMQQPFVFAVRELTGKRKAYRTGQIQPTKRLETGVTFGRSKLAPLPGGAVNLAQGKNLVGEAYSPKEFLRDNTLPLDTKDIVETAQNEGVGAATVAFVLSKLGFGVNYDPKR